MILPLIALLAASAPPPVRTAAERQILLDLAHVLGEAHALHRVCAGPADDTWRGRMGRLIDVEAPSETLKADLANAFNAGFTARDGKGKDCSAAAAAERELSRKGADLARKLGHNGT